ncbi:hypothetical protein BC833DRAFT_588570 [Globomyces pollinis-pini]|nr:hypothetical protein BC833DRAFT_588570 [Globomyces pollinis-pini]
MDVHCHVTDSEMTEESVRSLNTKVLFLMATRESDWFTIQDLLKSSLYNTNLIHSNDVAVSIPNLIPAFGIHPWFAHEHQSLASFDKLEQLIQSYPNSLVGEIGLDSVAVDSNKIKYPMDAQLDCFQKQFDLAIKYNRPVSIHSVHTHGLLLDYFRKLDTNCGPFKKQKLPLPAPPSIMLHSFLGSAQIASALIKLPRVGSRFYFSFSHFVNSRSPKTKSIISSLPDNRILIESDVHSISEVDPAMEKIVNLVADAKGWSTEFTIAQTIKNSLEFLQLWPLNP